MTMIRRRLMLAIGAALLVGGWGVAWSADQAHKVSGFPPGDEGAHQVLADWEEHDRLIFIGGIVGMAVGAGLIGFAVLRPMTRSVE